jgi:regulator of replication initiation timing
MASKKSKTKPTTSTKSSPSRKASHADPSKRLASLAGDLESLAQALESLRGEVEELTDDNDNLRERVDVLETQVATTSEPRKRDAREKKKQKNKKK